MPGQFESILDKLQAKLGKQTIRKASTINRPRPKREVQQIQIFNEFNRRNPRADGGRIGFRGGGAYQGGRSSTRRSSTSRGPAGGASAGGNYGGNRNPQQTYGGSIFRGGGGGGQTTTPTPTKTNTQNPFSKTNLQTHFANNQLLKNAVAKGILTIKNIIF